MAANGRGYALTALVALSCGCGRYADFSLPPAEAGGAVATFAWLPSREPVLSRGAPGEWDSIDVLNPSVVRFQGKYFNLYSGYDGHTWHTGVATSQDGGRWQKQGRVLSPSGWEGGAIAANGSALAEGSEILYWYQASDPPRIGLARSTDGVMWRKSTGPVVSPGPRGSFDERGVADPYVMRVGGSLYLFYLGMDRARRQRLGLARSSDGETWEKLRANPILELGTAGQFDESALGEPAVWSSGGSYWMLYTGSDRGQRRRIGLAKSRDGAHWTRESGFTPLAGTEKWNSQVLCDPTVELMGDKVRVWFGGGDVPSPDQNLHGQIGTGVLISAK